MRLLIVCALCGAQLGHGLHEAVSANPIRKVVNMLQAMTTKVEEEGKKEAELYEKFMCYCKGNTGTLETAITSAEVKIPAVNAALEEAEAKQAQLKADLTSHKTEREEAKQAIADATAMREKEAAEYAKTKGDGDQNYEAMKKAIAALEAGVGAGFLQTNSAAMVRKLVQASSDLTEDQKRSYTAFLSGSSTYAPISGEVIGMLKQMSDTLFGDLAAAEKAESDAIAAYEELLAAKEAQIAALTKAIEVKSERLGSLSVEIVNMKEDVEDTADALADDQDFLANLDKTCATKTSEWEERSKTRSEELLALAETIKILNDDDALELFKKTLPSPATSFVQVQVSAKDISKRALSALSALPNENSQIKLIMLALSGKKAGFEKVLTMIDDMVALLKKEQIDDDTKKANCTKDFDGADDEKKALEKTLSDLDKTIEATSDDLATLSADIKALKDSIAALDKSVAEATETRKEEHDEFQELMASDSAAKELLFMAKNRLAKFYNPKLYKPPPEKVLTEEEKIEAAFNDTSLLQSSKAAPPPPPETWAGYKTKMEENNGVLAMMDLLVKDLAKEMSEAEAEEKNAQAAYETAMEDASSSRAQDAKSLANKEGAKAELESSLETTKEDHAATGKDLDAKKEYIASLHGECDWLLKYFEQRKAARAEEVDALGRAKAILSGSDYSLVQSKTRHSVFLHRA